MNIPQSGNPAPSRGTIAGRPGELSLSKKTREIGQLYKKSSEQSIQLKIRRDRT